MKAIGFSFHFPFVPSKQSLILLSDYSSNCSFPCLSICPFIPLPVCLFFYSCNKASANRSIHPSVHLSIHPVTPIKTHVCWIPLASDPRDAGRNVRDEYTRHRHISIQLGFRYLFIGFPLGFSDFAKGHGSGCFLSPFPGVGQIRRSSFPVDD